MCVLQYFQVQLIYGAFHNQFAAFVAIDARPQSLIAGQLITSFVSNSPNVEVSGGTVSDSVTNYVPILHLYQKPRPIPIQTSSLLHFTPASDKFVRVILKHQIKQLLLVCDEFLGDHDCYKI